MNKARRTAIENIEEQLLDIKELLETLLEEEQAYFEAMPEGLAQTERGQNSEEAISNLELAVDGLGDALSSLEEARR